MYGGSTAVGGRSVSVGVGGRSVGVGGRSVGVRRVVRQVYGSVRQVCTEVVRQVWVCTAGLYGGVQQVWARLPGLRERPGNT